jgi:hypothetical protein
MDDYQPTISPPTLKRKLKNGKIKFAYPLKDSQVIVSADCIEDVKYSYLVVIKSRKCPGVKYIIAEDDEFIYIQYGWAVEPESYIPPEQQNN